MSEKSYYIPKHLDDPPKLFWWDADEVVVCAVILFPGFLLKSFLLFMVFLILSLIITREYIKIKAGRLKGFLVHFAYWVLGIKFKRVPESHIREFSG